MSKIRFKNITTPATTPSSTKSDLFVDVADGIMKHKKANGSIVSLEAGASGGVPNLIPITSVTDFPPAIADVITLPPFTNYQIVGFVNLGTAKLVSAVPGGTHVFVGINQATDILFTLNTDCMFGFDDNNLLIRELSLSAPLAASGAAKVTNTAGNEKTSNFQMINTFIDGGIGGTFTDLATVSSFIPGFVGNATAGFRFFGDFIRIALEDLQLENISGIALDFGTATWDSFVYSGVYTPSATNTFVSGLANSGNVNAGGEAKITNVRFEGTDAPTFVNITVDDIRWRFVGNAEIQDTMEDALLSFSGNTATTVITAINTPVKVNASWTIDRQSFYTCDTTGRAVYDGEADIITPFDGWITINPAVSNLTVSVYFAINGIVINTPLPQSVKSGDPQTIPIGWQASLSNGDFVEMFVENNSNTNNIVVENAIFRLN